MRNLTPSISTQNFTTHQIHRIHKTDTNKSKINNIRSSVICIRGNYFTKKLNLFQHADDADCKDIRR
jgi:hypothetical protein